jgi:hypothetical protein
MSGPAPKDPSIRARRNKSATASKLPADVAAKRAPVLPPLGEDHQWHPMTLLWWQDVWASPMAAEYAEADKHGLYRLAMLVEGFWRSPSKDLAGEIRLQEQRFGLSPLDRRRLEWTIESADEAKDRGNQRRGRSAGATKKAAASDTDPRSVLSVVS